MRERAGPALERDTEILEETESHLCDYICNRGELGKPRQSNTENRSVPGGSTGAGRQVRPAEMGQDQLDKECHPLSHAGGPSHVSYELYWRKELANTVLQY